MPRTGFARVGRRLLGVWRRIGSAERDAPSALSAAIILGVLVFAVAAWIQIWGPSVAQGGLFALDLKAYTSAAARLADSGTPYSLEVLSGPIANTVANVPIGYFYPPVLAQLFLPFIDVPHWLLGALWTAGQVAVALVVMPLLVPRGSPRLLLAALVMISSFPFQRALMIGNLSGWLAIGVGVLLIVGPRTSGPIAAAAALLKMTPAPLLLITLVGKASRPSAFWTAALVVSCSAAFAPRAWLDWFRALPNVLNNEMSLAPKNYSPAHVLADLGIPAGGLVQAGLAVLFGIWAIRIALRTGSLTAESLAAAVGSITLASTTLWDHYLAVLVPFTVFMWYRTDRMRRLVIWTVSLVFMGVWFGLDDFVPFRLVLTLAVVAYFVAISSAPRGCPVGPDGPMLAGKALDISRAASVAP